MSCHVGWIWIIKKGLKRISEVLMGLFEAWWPDFQILKSNNGSFQLIHNATPSLWCLMTVCAFCSEACCQHCYRTRNPQQQLWRNTNPATAFRIQFRHHSTEQRFVCGFIHPWISTGLGFRQQCNKNIWGYPQKDLSSHGKPWKSIGYLDRLRIS